MAPGGRTIVLNCGSHWPTTHVDDRHVFQFGGLGGLQPEEYHQGSERVAAFLADRGASRTRWDPPEPDGHSPEAEWGFEPTLRVDVVSFADEQDYRVRQLSIGNPRNLSDLVANLYREEYARRRLDTDRLLVQNFTLLDPWWTLRTGSVPYWLPFNSNPAARVLETYLESRSEFFDEIYMMLFSNGFDAAGQASIGRWRDLLDLARSRGEFVGVNPRTYPLDLGAYVRYNSALPETLPSRQPLLPPLSQEEFETYMEERAQRQAVGWKEH